MPSPIEALEGVNNAGQVLPTLVAGGQPAEAHFRALREAGVEVVLDIRDPRERRGFDQPALMAELGFDYEVVPVTDWTVNDETMERILEVLKRNTGRQTVFHCNSGNRIGGPLVAHLMLEHGMTEEDATTAALRCGLRGAGILQWGLAYVRAKGKG